MYTTEQKCEGTTESNGSNTADRFRTYRMGLESVVRKLKEAETVIQQLKDELYVSMNTEKNLRSQISSAQDRLVAQEKILKQFSTVSAQQVHNEKTSQQIEQTVSKLEEEIAHTLAQSKNVFNYASRELDLLKKINELESALNAKNCESDLKKMEIQTLAKEKKSMEAERRVEDLEKELEKSVKKEAETLTLTRETLLFYKKQIEEYEQKIDRYEKERKSFLEDFEPPRGSTIPLENPIMADSTVNTDERSPTCEQRCISEKDEFDTRICKTSSFSSKSKPTESRKVKQHAFQRVQARQKPQLEFLTISQGSSQPLGSSQCGKKRRLFSTNCNHYID